MIDTFNNENCFDTIKRIKDINLKVNIVLTSPPYNTSRKSNNDAYMQRYENHIDILTENEYIENTINLFNKLDEILETNGVILYNISYSTDNPILPYKVICEIYDKTNFYLADRIIWKKKNAIPDNRSYNRMTRIVEDVFVICRKNENKTFQSNKDITSFSKNGIYTYTPFLNFIDAKNNDENTALNKATFSTEFCDELIIRYAKKNDIIYDPYMGTGTTAISAKKNRCYFIGSEISEKQVKHSIKRLKAFKKEYKDCEYRPPVVNFCIKRKQIFNEIESLIPNEINNFYEINISNSGFIFSSFMEKKFNIKKYYLIDENIDFVNFYNVIKHYNILPNVEELYELWYLMNKLSCEIFDELFECIFNAICENKKFSDVQEVCKGFFLKRIKSILKKKKYDKLNINNLKENIINVIFYDIQTIHRKNENHEKIKKLVFNSLMVHTLGVFYYEIYDLFLNEENNIKKYSYWFILNSLRSRTDKYIFGGIHFINRQMTCRHRMMLSYDVKRIFNDYYTNLKYVKNCRYELSDTIFNKKDFILCTCNDDNLEKYLYTLSKIKCKWLLYNITNNKIYNNYII